MWCRERKAANDEDNEDDSGIKLLGMMGEGAIGAWPPGPMNSNGACYMTMWAVKSGEWGFIGNPGSSRKTGAEGRSSQLSGPGGGELWLYYIVFAWLHSCWSVLKINTRIHTATEHGYFRYSCGGQLPSHAKLPFPIHDKSISVALAVFRMCTCIT